jgi:hypothetical protein
VDAAERMVRAALADLNEGGARLEVAVLSHAVHGQVIRVSGEGAAGAEREALQSQVQERLGPLPLRHEVVWRQ